MRLRHLPILLLLTLAALPARAQDSLYRRPAHVLLAPDLAPAPKSIARPLRRARSPEALQAARQRIAQRMAEQGYAEYAIDTLIRQGDTLVAEVHQGPVYLLDSCAFGDLNETYAERAGLTRLARRPRPLHWDGLRRHLLLALDEYQDQGYPFACFDSLQIALRPDGDTLHSHIRYDFDPGGLVILDSVIVKGDIRERETFVRRLAGLQPGDPYNQSQIDQARRMLNGSIYFKNVKPAQVSFTAPDKAEVTLNLESRKSGKFDLLLGILPPREAGARLQFTGLVDIQLVSPIFRSGESVQFRFDKLPGSSQKMHLQYAHPYIFGSPMKVQGEFDLLKQDTLFQTRWGRFSTSYAFTPNLSMRVSYKGKTSGLISTAAYERDTTRVPPVLDGKDQTYGLGFEFENLDYRFNPRRGVRLSADAGLGRKRVTRNPRLAEQLYEGLQLNLPKAEIDLQAEWYRSYTKRLVLRLANRTYWLDQRQYFQNDLLQAGGSRSIRGFNENEFFANFLTLFSIENRFLLEENSYLFVFSDYAYLEDATATERIKRPWGLGLGLTYETKAGMLSIMYAAGAVGEQSFQPARGRIHIGLINQF